MTTSPKSFISTSSPVLNPTAIKGYKCRTVVWFTDSTMLTDRKRVRFGSDSDRKDCMGYYKIDV